MDSFRRIIGKFVNKLRKIGREAVVMTPGPLENMFIVSGKLPANSTPLTAPIWLPAQNARHMRPDDPVLGLLVDGLPYALPWWILKNHHVANLTLEGRPIVVKLCEICSSAAAFNPVLQDTRLTFQAIGAYKGTFVTMDHETRSIWASFTGECLTGPLRGKQLEQLPLYQATWAEWISLHSRSLVPDGRGEQRQGHGAHMFPGSAESDRGMAKTLVHRDERLPFNELVLGVKSDGHARVYPLVRLHQVGPVLNDALGAQKIVIFSKPKSWMAMAFSCEVDGKCLVFKSSEDGKIVDRDTMSLWNMFGQATSGPLAGRSLAFMPSLVEEWSAWAAYLPATEIFDGPNRP